MKRWYLTGPVAGGAYRFVKEAHFVCVQSPSERASGARSSSGWHFGGVSFTGPSEVALFEKHVSATVHKLGHVHTDAGKPLPPEVVDALSGYGIVSGDCVRTAVQKVVTVTGNWPLALHEI